MESVEVVLEIYGGKKEEWSDIFGVSRSPEDADAVPVEVRPRSFDPPPPTPGRLHDSPFSRIHWLCFTSGLVTCCVSFSRAPRTLMLWRSRYAAKREGDR